MTRVSFSSELRLPGDFNVRAPFFDMIVEDYCGLSMSELIKMEESDYETGSFWAETDVEPTKLQKMLVEMLHLASVRGEEC